MNFFQRRMPVKQLATIKVVKEDKEENFKAKALEMVKTCQVKPDVVLISFEICFLLEK